MPKPRPDLRIVGGLTTAMGSVLARELGARDREVADLRALLDLAYTRLGEIETREAIIPERGEKGDRGDAGPAGRDGVDGKDGKDGKDGAPGRDGIDGKDGVDGLPGVSGERGLPGRDGVDGKDGPAGRDGKDGSPGRDGRDGIDGKDGQPGRDGEKGDRGEGFRFRGLYDNSQRYDAGDVVMSDIGSAFVARIDDPGAMPGDGWRLMVKAGRPGRRGEKGDRGEQGPRGPMGPQGIPGRPGRDAVSIEEIEGNENAIVVMMTDGNVKSFPLPQPRVVERLMPADIDGGLPVSRFMGAWSRMQPYRAGDMVVVAGSLWLCAEPNTGQYPTVQSIYWALMIRMPSGGGGVAIAPVPAASADITMTFSDGDVLYIEDGGEVVNF